MRVRFFGTYPAPSAAAPAEAIAAAVGAQKRGAYVAAAVRGARSGICSGALAQLLTRILILCIVRLSLARIIKEPPCVHVIAAADEHASPKNVPLRAAQ